MTQLSLTGVSADGRRLLLVSDNGAEFSLDVTPALRAALRGETTRLGQLEIKMTSTLRPREIQDRIRSGETPEAVATAAGTTVESIMSFVAPVLAEREHVAERAQRSSVRRAAGSGGSQARALSDAVTAHLLTQDAKADQVLWDAARRDDGRWTLTAVFDAPRRAGTAHFTYDAPGNYVTADDEDARWLIGDLVAAPAPVAPPNDLEQARQRRLAALPSDELPLGDDALDLLDAVRDAPAEPATDNAAEAATETDAAPAAEPAAESENDDRARSRRTVQKRRGRASVPSWDEIMFGGSSE
ncbi:septation protein SepH [Nocardioides panacisoli]|uniref:DUF3071 domain-containing protein n=1 Tax=Nocardioides panacisoli TaxID=627624 RepID=A0ABP7IML5_9ACTN